MAIRHIAFSGQNGTFYLSTERWYRWSKHQGNYMFLLVAGLDTGIALRPRGGALNNENDRRLIAR